MRELLVVAAACFFATIAPPAVAQSANWRLMPARTMAPKRLVYDSARQRLVMVESSAQGNVFRTWERIGDAWSLRWTPATPPPRDGFALGYDPVRSRTVLFGGRDAYPPSSSTPLSLRSDTWEYDGVTWVQRTFPVSPAPHTESALVFDYANSRLLLLNSYLYGSTTTAWSYDGVAWLPAPAPPFLPYSAAIASDRLRRQIVAYRALGSNPPVTHIWNGSGWSIANPPQSPPPRTQGALVFDESIGMAVLLTGQTPAYTAATDRWGWDGTNWTPLPGPPTPPRMFASFAYDAASNRTIGVGGYEHGHPIPLQFTETMSWDGATWSGTGTTYWLPDFAACFDESSSRLVVFDWRGTGAEFDGRGWTPRTAMPCAGILPTVAFDRLRQRLVFVCNGSVHEWIGGAWSNLGTAPAAAREALVYHEGRGRVLAVSAASGVHEWDGMAWTQVAPGAGFTNGTATHASYDRSSNQLFVCAFVGSVLRVATWNGTAWTVQSPPSSPPRRDNYALGFDPLTQRMMLFGGNIMFTGPPVQFDDLWEWTGVTWQQRTFASGPSLRFSPVFVEVPWLRRLALIGGHHELWNGGYTQFGDVWALDGPAANVSVLGPGCGGPLGAPALTSSTPHPTAPAFTLDLANAAANAPALFALSWSQSSVPVGGGCTKWLAEPLHLVAIRTDAAGRSTAQGTIPLALSGVSFAAQAAVLDAGAPIGVALSNGVMHTIGW